MILVRRRCAPAITARVAVVLIASAWAAASPALDVGATERAAPAEGVTSTQRPDGAELPRIPEAEEITVIAPSRLPRTSAQADGLDVLVIEREELESSGVRTVQDALRSLPGVHLSDEQGNGFQQDLSVRGFTASPVTGLAQGVSVFVDGVRVNEPAAEEVNFDLIPITEVERIEVIRGPTAIFGRNTIGGSVHVLTRRGGPRREAEVEAELGSWWRREGNARVAGPIGPLDGYLAIGGVQDPGWRVRSEGEGGRAFGKVGLHRGGTDLALSYQFQVDRLEQAGSLPRAMLDQDRRQNYTPGDFFRPTLHLVTLNATQQLTPALSASANAFFRALDAEQFNSSYLDPDTRLSNHTRSVGAAVQLDHKGSLGALRNRVSVGGEVAHNSVRIEVAQEPNATFQTADGAPLPRGLADLSDGQLAVGAFVQDAVQFAQGPLGGLGAAATLRFDRISHSILDTSPVNPGSATGDAVYSAWAPAVGVNWQFAPRWLAAASYSEGFRAPAFLEITCADASAPCVGLQAGVAPDATFTHLKAVRSRAYEVGLTTAPWLGVTTAVTAFRVDLQDDIYGITPAGTTSVYFQNVGSTRRQGVEAAVHLRRRVLDVDASYAYTRATFESDLTLATPRTPEGTEAVHRGATLPLSPEHRVDVVAHVRPLPWWTVEAGAQWVAAQYYRGDEANVAPRIPGYVVARAGAEVRWGEWTASLRVHNLFDARYETFGTFARDGKAPGQPVVPFLTPGLPLRVVAALRWELG